MRLPRPVKAELAKTMSNIMTKQILLTVQIIFSLLLIGLILIQSKGSGLGPLGGKIGVYSTKRGVEKLFYNLTVIIAILFFVSSFVQLLIG